MLVHDINSNGKIYIYVFMWYSMWYLQCRMSDETVIEPKNSSNDTIKRRLSQHTCFSIFAHFIKIEENQNRNQNWHLSSINVPKAGDKNGNKWKWAGEMAHRKDNGHKRRQSFLWPPGKMLCDFVTFFMATVKSWLYYLPTYCSCWSWSPIPPLFPAPMSVWHTD